MEVIERIDPPSQFVFSLNGLGISNSARKKHLRLLGIIFCVDKPALLRKEENFRRNSVKEISLHRRRENSVGYG
jgi:hypothetical protein